MNFMMRQGRVPHRSQGFTLIEILVVVSIIAILSAIVSISVVGSTATARDATRKAHLDQIMDAFEERFIDTNTYAMPNTGWYEHGHGWFNICGIGNYTGECMDQVLVDEGYLTDTPHDPLVERNRSSGTGGHRPYMRYCRQNISGTWRCNEGIARYMCVTAQLENPSPEDEATLENSELSPNLIDSLQNDYSQNYAVCSGGL